MRERGDVYGVVIIASRGRMKETARSIDAATSLQAAERERERARSSELGRAGESWSLITAVASRRQFDRVLCRSLNDVAAGSIATHTAAAAAVSRQITPAKTAPIVCKSKRPSFTAVYYSCRHSIR